MRLISRRGSSHGFTLIELFVASLIAVLKACSYRPCRAA